MFFVMFWKDGNRGGEKKIIYLFISNIKDLNNYIFQIQFDFLFSFRMQIPKSKLCHMHLYSDFNSGHAKESLLFFPRSFFFY